MAILHIIDHMGLGGAQRIVLDLVEKNEEHYVFALRRAEDEFLSKDNSKFFFFNGWFKYSILPVFMLRKIIKDNSISVLHVHLAKSLFIVYLYSLLFPSNIKIVMNEHGAIFSKKRSFYKFLLRRIQKYNTHFIAVSKETKKALVNQGFIEPKNITLLYNFIDFDSINFLSSIEKKRLKNKLNIPKNKLIIGFVGRIAGVKNIDTLIEAYTQLNDSSLTLLIVGSGELLENLKLKAKNTPSIIFLGYREDIKSIYQILDIIVLPSSSEASPMAYYESQVYGTPFIGSDVYAINEFIQDGINGLLFECLNAQELSKKIQILIKDPKYRKEISVNALSKMSQFDWKQYIVRLEEIYEK